MISYWEIDAEAYEEREQALADEFCREACRWDGVPEVEYEVEEEYWDEMWAD